jgi:hypothetical protein
VTALPVLPNHCADRTASGLVAPALRLSPAVDHARRLGRSIIANFVKALLTTLDCVAMFSATLLLTGCEHSAAPDHPNPPVGKSCSIQFRRDALGAGASGPSSPLAGNINGADVAISGTLKSTSGEWVVLLDSKGRETWVPKAVILLIQF